MNWKILLALIVLYFLYLIMGAVVFGAIERPVEVKQCTETVEHVEELLRLVSENRDNITVKRMMGFTKIIQKAMSYGIRIDEDFNVTCSINWDFQNAFFFSGSVITTIGYGNIYPNTELGRYICILYAFLGIPLFGLMFSGLGDAISKRMKRIHNRAKGRVSRTWVAKTTVILYVLAICIIFYLIIPAAIFQAVEEWSYGDSFYYAFVTLTTIGFGDFVAGTNPKIHYPPIYRVMVYFWILFGLAFMATVITLISDLFKKTGKIARKRGDQSTEEDDGNNPDEIELKGDVGNCENIQLNTSDEVIKFGIPRDDATDITGSLERKPFTGVDGVAEITAAH